MNREKADEKEDMGQSVDIIASCHMTSRG